VSSAVPTNSLARFRFAVVADYTATRTMRMRYPTDGPSMKTKGLAAAAVTQVGFQMLIAVRLMQLANDVRLPGVPQIISRLIRHLYGAEIHWHADIAPGICVVHGNGLVISHGAVVGVNCLLFQHVTLGESMHSGRRVVGSPTLEENVHVMPGAVLLGPITVGAGSKVGANAVVDDDVAAGSVVSSPAVDVRLRRSGEVAG
jgi:serine O-acetyltransferase